MVIKIFSRNCLYWRRSQARWWCQGNSHKVPLSMHSKLTPLYLLMSPRKTKQMTTTTNTQRSRKDSYTQTFILVSANTYLESVNYYPPSRTHTLTSYLSPVTHRLAGVTLAFPHPWEFSWPLCISSSWVSIFLVSFVLNKYFSTHKTHGQSPWTYQSDLIWPLISLSSWHMLCSPDITSHVWKLDKLGWA